MCGRGSTKGASRSHSKIKTLKRQNINLQNRNVEGMSVKLCASCLRTLEKPKRVKAKRKPALKEGEKKAPKTARTKAKAKAKA